MARGIALLAGLKSVDPFVYGGWDGTSGAKGCEHDVDNMVEVISGVGKYEINTLKTQQATASAILGGIESARCTLKSGDTFVFYYSGHGGQKPNTNGDEPDGKNETLIAYDREIVDDELGRLWLGFASGVRIVMLSDSCNSGTNNYLVVMGGIQDVTAEPAIQAAQPINFTGKIPEMKAQMIHFGACRDGGASAGFMSGGAFTLALCEVWNNGKFSGTYRQFYDAIKGRVIKAGVSQEPQFNLLGDVSHSFLNARPFSLC